MRPAFPARFVDMIDRYFVRNLLTHFIELFRRYRVAALRVGLWRSLCAPSPPMPHDQFVDGSTGGSEGPPHSLPDLLALLVLFGQCLALGTIVFSRGLDAY
jgi:hypothetical protein